MAFFEDEIKTSGSIRRKEREESLDVDFNNEDEEDNRFLDDIDSNIKEKEDNFLDLEDL